MVKTVDQYGAPQYGALASAVAGMVFHSPEFGTTPTLANAIACAKWQATSGNTSGGSYHGIIGHSGSDDIAKCTTMDHWVMVRSVPWNRISGGLSTRRDSVWAPQRYPWIKQLVSAEAYADPNRFFHQIALSGRAAWYVQNGYPVGLLKALAAWVLLLEKAYHYNSVLTLHRMWQTNRTDPGPVDLGDRVMVYYNALVNPPKPAPTPEPKPEPKPDPLQTALGRITTKDAKVKIAIAALNDALEA